MHPILRIILELFGPSLFGIIIIYASIASRYMTIGYGEPSEYFLTVVYSAPSYCGIQSILYMILMEIAGLRIKRRSRKTLLLSTALGFLSGGIISSGIDGFHPDKLPTLLFFCGGLVGLSIASIIYFFEETRNS